MGYFLPYIFALGTLGGIAAGGAWTWLGVALIFGLNLGLDEWIGDREIRPSFLRRVLFHSSLSELSVLISFPFLVFFLGFSLWRMAGMSGGLEISGAVLSVGVTMGMIGINAAHELIHRRSDWQRAEGVLNLALVNFGWYRISHIEIHHRWVGTEKDCSTAGADENFWKFAPRCLWGTLRGAWSLEFAKAGFGFGNRMLHYLGLSLLVGALVYFLGEAASGRGWFVVGVWLLVSVVAILVLKTADYIEHKGLSRGLVSEGRYEPVRAGHSWDSYHLITNFSLFNLGYHSNHHLKAAVPFTGLGRVDGAKVMPHGYALMVVRALVGIG